MTWRMALITGASSGLGAAFAQRLGRAGTNLVLVARSDATLERRAERIRDRWAVTVEIVDADLTVDRDLEQVAARLADDANPVDLLVNNAGIGSVGAFVELPSERVETVIRLNAMAMLRLTHAASMHMARRHGGTILNVSSLAAYAPVPYFAVYSASKAFVLMLSLAVRQELRGSGVCVTALCPAFVDTEFAEKAGVADPPARRWWADADDVARAGLSGARRRRAVVLPGPATGLASGVAQIVPPSLFARAGATAVRAFAPTLVRRATSNAGAAPEGPPPEQERNG